MRVKANVDTCVGTGQCEAALGSVFAVGDEGVVEVDQDAVEQADADQLRRAIRVCPTDSLSLEQD
jgi:ferredoxin